MDLGLLLLVLLILQTVEGQDEEEPDYMGGSKAAVDNLAADNLQVDMDNTAPQAVATSTGAQLAETHVVLVDKRYM